MQSSVVAACDGYTRNASRAPLALTLISGALDVLVRHGLLKEEEWKR